LADPIWRPLVERLARHRRLVRYERGCGLSDWEVDEFSVDALVRDLEAVVDAAGLERFPLLGLSQGGPIVVAYAARHPERVSRLILYGTYSCGYFKRGPTPAQHVRRESSAYVAPVVGIR
jgi:pimeloyl-ACP methyl ester carboxylesterase